MNLPKFTPPMLILQATEAQFQRTVIEMAHYLGYRAHHETDSRRTNPGFPDLLLASPRRGQVVFFELKRESKHARPSVEQVEWLRTLRGSGHHAYVIRPSHFDLAESILRGEVAPPEVGTGNPDPLLAELVAQEENPIQIARVKRKESSRRPRRS